MFRKRPLRVQHIDVSSELSYVRTHVGRVIDRLEMFGLFYNILSITEIYLMMQCSQFE